MLCSCGRAASRAPGWRTGTRSYHKMMLFGRVASDVTFNEVPKRGAPETTVPVSGFTVRTSEAAGMGKRKWCLWRVSAWGHLAPIAAEMEKGSSVFVEGVLLSDKNGNPRCSLPSKHGDQRGRFEMYAINLRHTPKGESEAPADEDGDPLPIVQPDL